MYPFGELGVVTKRILEEQFGLNPVYIFDENISKFNPHVKASSALIELNKEGNEDIVLILATADPAIHDILREKVLGIISEKRILDVFQKDLNRGGLWNPKNWEKTQCGKHSYGGLCNHPLVKQVGAFCSFAAGSTVINNHPTNLLSTSPFLTGSGGFENVEGFKEVPYEAWESEEWYISGLVPQGKVPGVHRITIGNDVWLGANVIITNYSDIGDGVIAAAGAVITKTVPAYAIVAGVPARIIKFRYNPKQIEDLERIKWWNWDDEVIRERYDDFFLPIDEFIEKYIE
ncbi:CatB-related O-acetyltransferase [Selenomonas caprae]|uniref:CatB-related O-acetyltransferase n=1 Tax=Selenomonas caprae TaxID=2606905 RepID=A0A5D6WJG5_9FIRM|nr:CatB-related O-acetyltransferase [Selenomonas caprae]